MEEIKNIKIYISYIDKLHRPTLPPPNTDELSFIRNLKGDDYG